MVDRIDPLDSSYNRVALPATYKVAAARQVTPVAPKEVPKQPLPATAERAAGLASQAGQQTGNRESEQAKKQPTPKICISCQGGGTGKTSGSEGGKDSINMVTNVCPECGQVHVASEPSSIEPEPSPQQLDVHI
jgi:hypothetical protein